jgi:hypothetical protein
MRAHSCAWLSRGEPGTGRLATNIQNIGPLLHQSLCVSQGEHRIRMLPAIGK